MKISTKSWHYRLLGFYNFSHPPNLCPYFWKVVATVLVTPFLFLLVIIGGPILDWAENRNRHKEEKEEKPPKISHSTRRNIITLFGVVWCSGFALWFSIREDWIMMGVMLGMMIWFIIPPSIKFRKYSYKEPKPKKPKEPNIAWEYLKAKKHKYCPVITFYTPEMEDESWKKGLQ